MPGAASVTGCMSLLFRGVARNLIWGGINVLMFWGRLIIVLQSLAAVCNAKSQICGRGGRGGGGKCIVDYTHNHILGVTRDPSLLITVTGTPQD